MRFANRFILVKLMHIFNNVLFTLKRLNWNRDTTQDFSDLLDEDKLSFNKLSISFGDTFYLLKMDDNIVLVNNLGVKGKISMACLITNFPKYDLENKVFIDTFVNIWDTAKKNNTATTTRTFVML